MNGLALYWAEGTKAKFGFANTDPRMLKIMIAWFKKFFVPLFGCKINYGLQCDLDIVKESVMFWSEVLNISGNLIKAYRKSGNTRMKHGVFYIRPTYMRVGNKSVFIQTLLDLYCDYIACNYVQEAR